MSIKDFVIPSAIAQDGFPWNEVEGYLVAGRSPVKEVFDYAQTDAKIDFLSLSLNYYLVALQGVINVWAKNMQKASKVPL